MRGSQFSDHSHTFLNCVPFPLCPYVPFLFRNGIKCHNASPPGSNKIQENSGLCLIELQAKIVLLEGTSYVFGTAVQCILASTCTPAVYRSTHAGSLAGAGTLDK